MFSIDKFLVVMWLTNWQVTLTKLQKGMTTYLSFIIIVTTIGVVTVMIICFLVCGEEYQLVWQLLPPW